MTFKMGSLATAALSLMLSASAFAMTHREDQRGQPHEDHAQYHAVALRVHRVDHDRQRHSVRGWDKGRKEGWRGGNVPPSEWRRRNRRDRDRASHYRRNGDRQHIGTNQAVYSAPAANRPTSPQNRNGNWGDNVRARKGQASRQAQGGYMKH